MSNKSFQTGGALIPTPYTYIKTKIQPLNVWEAPPAPPHLYLYSLDMPIHPSIHPLDSAKSVLKSDLTHQLARRGQQPR